MLENGWLVSGARFLRHHLRLYCSDLLLPSVVDRMHFCPVHQVHEDAVGTTAMRRLVDPRDDVVAIGGRRGVQPRCDPPAVDLEGVAAFSTVRGGGGRPHAGVEAQEAVARNYGRAVIFL